MVKLNKIYTRTGDGGSAGLVDGSRVSKSSLRMAAIGDIDEANAAIGVAIAALRAGEVALNLVRIQNDLFDLGADAATPGNADGALRIVAGQVARLEVEIDDMNAIARAADQLHPAERVGRRSRRFTSPARSCAAPSASAVALNEARTAQPAPARVSQPPVGPFVRQCAVRRQGRGRRRALAAGRDAQLSALAEHIANF